MPEGFLEIVNIGEFVIHYRRTTIPGQRGTLVMVQTILEVEELLKASNSILMK